MNKNQKKASELKVVKSEKTLETMLAEKRKMDVDCYTQAIEDAGKKYKCGIQPTATIMPNGQIQFQLTPVNIN